METKKGCYYCLAEAVEPVEQTGDGCALCPNCGIDSVMDYEDYEVLLAKHVQSFHFGSRGDCPETICLPCGHQKCVGWNKYLNSVAKE